MTLRSPLAGPADAVEVRHEVHAQAVLPESEVPRRVGADVVAGDDRVVRFDVQAVAAEAVDDEPAHHRAAGGAPDQEPVLARAGTRIR